MSRREGTGWRSTTQRLAGREAHARREASLCDHVKWASLSILVILVSLLAAGCATSDGHLRWREIAQGQRFNKPGELQHFRLSDFVYVGRDPRLIVIDDGVAVSSLQDRVLPSHLRRISRINYSTSWVAVIYQGYKCRPGYSIEVNDVTLEANAVTIYAEFHEPDNYAECSGLPDTSPYYALRINKPPGLKAESPAFVLNVDGQLIPRVCAIEGEPVPWEPLVNNPEANGPYIGESPRLDVVTDQNDGSLIQEYVSPWNPEWSSAVDLRRDIVIVVRHGDRYKTGYSVEVIDVRRQGGTIQICAQFHEPRPTEPTGGMVISPYYVLKISKTKELQGELTLVLLDNGSEVARETATIQ